MNDPFLLVNHLSAIAIFPVTIYDKIRYKAIRKERCTMSGRQVKLEHAEKGSILYHYTKSNGINGIINHNCFWAT